MRELVIQALVLDKEDFGEKDARVFLYSPDHGKIIGKIKSAKSPLSKLNGHLEPFALVQTRLVGKGRQIADALVIKKLKPTLPLAKFFNFIKEITFEEQDDLIFWQMIKKALFSQRFNYQQFLAHQGFDPKFALCHNCQRPNPQYFFYQDADFWCADCLFSEINFHQTCFNGFIAVS